jgi:DNA-binding MarR family transcriptional regulator
MIGAYLEVFVLVSRVHRAHFQAIRQALTEISCDDINSVQAFILYNVGYEKRPVDAIRNQTNYLGLYISQIIRTLIKNGYLLHERKPDDYRIVNVWLSDKGRALCNRLVDIHQQSTNTSSDRESTTELERAVWTLRQIEQLCIDHELGC